MLLEFQNVFKKWVIVVEARTSVNKKITLRDI